MVSCKGKSAKHFIYQTMLMSTEYNVTCSVFPSITTLTVCKICLHFPRINLILILINEHKKLSSYFRELAHGVAVKGFSEADAIPSLDNKRHGSTNDCSGSLLGLSTVSKAS